MCAHDHKIRSKPLLCSDDQIAGVPDFDYQRTPERGRYILGILFEPSASVFDLRLVKVFGGKSFSRALRGQRIYLHDVHQVKSSAGIHRKRRGVCKCVSRVWIKVNGTQYFAIWERQSKISPCQSCAILILIYHLNSGLDEI
jgi:hypothetical protein